MKEKKSGTYVFPDNAGIGKIKNTIECGKDTRCEKLQRHIDYYQTMPLPIFTSLPVDGFQESHCRYCKGKNYWHVTSVAAVKAPVKIQFKP